VKKLLASVFLLCFDRCSQTTQEGWIVRHYSTQTVTAALIELRKPAEQFSGLEDLLRHEWEQGNIRGTSEKWTAFNGSLERAFAYQLALHSGSVPELGMFLFESIMGGGENPMAVIDIARSLARLKFTDTMYGIAGEYIIELINDCHAYLFDMWAEQEELERAVQLGIDNELER